MTGAPQNLGVDTFPDPVSHFWAHWRPFWILQAVRRCRRCGVAGGERVPPAPLGWYSDNYWGNRTFLWKSRIFMRSSRKCEIMMKISHFGKNFTFLWDFHQNVWFSQECEFLWKLRNLAKISQKVWDFEQNMRFSKISFSKMWDFHENFQSLWKSQKQAGTCISCIDLSVHKEKLYDKIDEIKTN